MDVKNRYEIQEEILNEIKEIVIDCPECKNKDDDYNCATCMGDGEINVYEWLNLKQQK